MKYSYLVGKLAGDKYSKKLGKIIAVEKMARISANNKSKSQDKLVEHLIIHVKRLFQKDLGVPIDCKKIAKIEGNFVWLDLTKDEFETKIKNDKDIILNPKRVIRDEEDWHAYGFVKTRDKL